MKNNYHSSSCVTNTQESRFSDLPEEYHSLEGKKANDYHLAPGVQNKKVDQFSCKFFFPSYHYILHLEAIMPIPNKQVKYKEASLVGALRKEQMAETAIQKLEAELKRMNYLACLIIRRSSFIMLFWKKILNY